MNDLWRTLQKLMQSYMKSKAIKLLRIFQNSVHGTIAQTTVVSDQTWAVDITVPISEMMVITQW